MSQFRNSQELINLETTLDSIPENEARKLLSEAVNGLAHQGILKLQGLDMGEIARGFYFRFLDLETVNELLSNRKSISTLEYRCSQLNELGLNVLQKRLNNYHYFIEAVRP